MSRNKQTHLFTRLLIRLVQDSRITLYRLLSTNSVQGNPTRVQPVQFVGRGKIIFEECVKVGVFPSPLFFSTYAYIEARSPAAVIKIGANTWINNNFCAIADHGSISIGRNCSIGANVEILDSDFHPINAKDRKNSSSSHSESVHIGNDVFVGSNVKIMKGVTIGDRCVIANGAVVTKTFPSDHVVGGVPAKTVKTLQ